MPEVLKQAPPRVNELYERHKAQIDVLAKKYPIRRSLLLPVLWIVQEEDGWISPEIMSEVAEICECTPAEVNEVVSFYVMYHRAPVGKFVLGICPTLPCALCAADGLYDYIHEKLGIAWNETTADKMFTLERRECLGACSEAPVMLVNQDIETKLTRVKVDQILNDCREGKRKPYFSGRLK